MYWGISFCPSLASSLCEPQWIINFMSDEKKLVSMKKKLAS